MQLLNFAPRVRMWFWWIGVSSAIVVKGVIELPLSPDVTSVVREGQRQYELIKEKSNLPDSGQCWKNAVAHLHHGCRHLTENLQIELALRFADCFMQSSGHSGIDCLSNDSDGSPINQQDCIRNLTDRVFLTYTEFYTHSQSMCLFLMSQVWHQETQKTIDKLWSSASDVSKRLEEAGKLQESLLDGQKESMNVQQTLLDNSHQLGNLVHDSASTLAIVFKEFRSTAAEQQQLLGQVFHHLSALQSWIVGEVSWIDSLVFYICTTFFAYLITSPRRVSDARFPLFIVLLTSAAAERLLAYYILSENSDPESIVLISTLKEHLYWWLWILRRGSLVVCALVITIVFYKYADQEQQRHQLLLQIWSQNKEMISFLQNKLVVPGLIGVSEEPDSAGYTAVRVNNSVPSTPRTNGFCSPSVRNPEECSLSPRHYFKYSSGHVTPTLDSVLSGCPTPPTDNPLVGDTTAPKLSQDATSSPLRNGAQSELRTSSGEDAFHSLLKSGSESSTNSDDMPLYELASKLPAKTPARSRRKSPARAPISGRATPYNLRRQTVSSLA